MIPSQLLGPLIHLNGAFPFLHLQRSLREPGKVQQALLRRLVLEASESHFGLDHGFRKVDTIRDFQARVPIQTYDTLLPYLRGVLEGNPTFLLSPRDRILMFGLTSGSTGEPKRIPVTQGYVDRFKKTYRLWSSLCLRDHPGLLEGTFFALFSDWRETFTPGGIPCGAVTGLIAQLQTPWIKKRMTLPFGIALLKDPEVRERAALHHALAKKVTVFTAANPSSLLRLARRLETEIEDCLRELHDGAFRHLSELSEGHRSHRDFRPQPMRAREIEASLEKRGGPVTPESVWPEAGLVGCWMGGTLSPYLEALRRYFPTTPFRDPGLVASEGRFTVPVGDETASGVPDLNGVFFEFYPAGEGSEVPVGRAEPLLLPHELEVGMIYHLIFTTGWGLYRYDIGDLVEVTEKQGLVPLIRFVRKASGYASITGEKLSEDQLIVAASRLPREFAVCHGDFVLAPRWGDPPGYVLVVEADRSAPNEELRAWVSDLDSHLRGLNLEYDSKRGGCRLAAIDLLAIPPGSFETLRREEIARAGGRAEQYKLKRIRGDYEFLETLAATLELAPH